MTGPCEIDHTRLHTQAHAHARAHTQGPLQQWGWGGRVGYGAACFVSPGDNHAGVHEEPQHPHTRMSMYTPHIHVGKEGTSRGHLKRRGLPTLSHQFGPSVFETNLEFSQNGSELFCNLSPPGRCALAEALISIHRLTPAQLLASLMPVTWRGS